MQGEGGVRLAARCLTVPIRPRPHRAVATRIGRYPSPARLLGAGVRGAQTVAGATGVDRAVEVATEEAIVAAVESEAVERALTRVLQGPAVEQAVQGALQSEALKQALIEALDSEMVDEIWRRLLASDEAQQLVERIAEAPEVRAAVVDQGVGLISDIGRQVARFAHRFDRTVERIARRIVFRGPRAEPSGNAGVVSRALAIGVDLVIVNLSFSALAAIVALIGSAFSGNADGASEEALVLGATAWLGLGALYQLVFWTLTGQTPGMRFLRIKLDSHGKGRLHLGQAVKRLIGLGLSIVTFGIGFLGILFNQRRRGWEDRLSDSEVLYIEPTVSQNKTQLNQQEENHSRKVAAGLAAHSDIWTVHYDVTAGLVRDTDTADAQAVFISCTNLPTYDVIAPLERELGKPVLTANQVTMWSALHVIGRKAVGPGQQLLER